MTSSLLFTNILTSLHQCPTPLNSLYFSEFNLNLIHQAIRQQVKKNTGVSIDKQNESDLLAIMRSVFINNSSDPYSGVCAQVKQMNTVVINTAIKQIYTGISQYINYSNNLDMSIQPMDMPINTSTYGDKIPINDKIGI